MSLSWLSLGSMVGYTTTALYQLKNEDNKNVRMDDELGSWFAASFWLGGILACSFGGYLGGILGRRKLIIFTSPINIAGWIILGNKTKTELCTYIQRTYHRRINL